VIHRVTFRAFAAATEDEARIKEALAIFVPLDSIFVTPVEGYFGNPMKILGAILRKREGLRFFQMLKEQLPKEDLQRLRREVPERISGTEFHLRLDKQAAYKGIVRLTDSKDAIAVTALVESYPARYEEAVRVVGEIL
jgi:RNA-binding protein